MHEGLGWLRQETLGEDEVRRASAYAAGVPFVALGRDDIDREAMLLIPEPLARRHGAVAYARGSDGSLEVALLSLDDLPALRFLPHKLKPRLTTRASLKAALLLYQKYLKEQFAGMLERGEDAADALLRHALLSGASHVHLEPLGSGQTGGALVRYRIGGGMTEAMRLSAPSAAAARGELKRLARLFPVETAAQEGGFSVEHEDGPVSVGVAAVPTVRGERLSLRLAQERHGQSGFSLPALGLHGRALERMHELMAARRGLVTAAGEGATTLLYTLLDLLASPRLSLASVEASAAARLPGVWQTQTRPEIGLGTASALRAVLRQDPDIVMVDPLDSAEAAAAAAAAARRGVFVLAAPREEAPVEADARIELALVRRLCPHCRQAYKPARAELNWFEERGARFSRVLGALKAEEAVPPEQQWKDMQLYRAGGCEQCGGSGFSGRIGVQALEPRQGEEDLSLLEDALFKAATGLVGLEDAVALFIQ